MTINPIYVVLGSLGARDDENFVAKPVPTKSESNHHLIADVPESEVRRRADGSIDIEFDKERAQRLRRSIREFSRGWF